MAKKVFSEDEQEAQRMKMLSVANRAIIEMEQYLKEGYVWVQGKQTAVTGERINTWKLAFSKTMPDLKASEVIHKTAYQRMSDEEILNRLSEIAARNPGLASKLQAALGGRVINVTNVEAPKKPLLSLKQKRSINNRIKQVEETRLD